jgi:sigma-B regulation protein RsbU (phosphoserine phosphatase)
VTDLLTKPVHPRETIARALAHLERAYLRREGEERHRRIQEELEEAVILQNILLPREEVIDAIQQQMQVDIAHYYHPASELAGDYISIRRLTEDRFAIVSIDISGHGLTAALYAFSVHTLIEDAVLTTQTPAHVLTILNERLHDFMSAGKFATAFIAVIDTRHHYIDYAAAAAPPPILIGSEKPMLLDTRGHLLGVDNHARYQNHRLPYQVGDRLFIYSDALIESPNAQGVSMSTEEVVSHLCATERNAASATYLKNMMDALYGRYTPKPADDLSMIICRL